MFKQLITKEFMFQVFTQICFGMVGALLLQVIIQKTQPNIATVNITAIQDSFIRETAKQSLSKEEMERKVTLFSSQLNQTIHKISKENHVTLFLTEAVISGSKDYTQAVADQVKKGMLR